MPSPEKKPVFDLSKLKVKPQDPFEGWLCARVRKLREIIDESNDSNDKMTKYCSNLSTDKYHRELRNIHLKYDDKNEDTFVPVAPTMRLLVEINEEARREVFRYFCD